VLFGGAESVRGQRRTEVFGSFWSAQQATLRGEPGDKTFDAAYADGPILVLIRSWPSPRPSSTRPRTRLGPLRPDTAVARTRRWNRMRAGVALLLRGLQLHLTGTFDVRRVDAGDRAEDVHAS